VKAQPWGHPAAFLQAIRIVQFRAEVCHRQSVRVIRLAGRLEREQAPDLVGLCDEVPKTSQLDVRDLVSADAVGFHTLGMLRRRGIELVGASPYVAIQLDFEQANHARKLVMNAGPSCSTTATQIDDTTDREER
jgi:hypothetical protein